MPEVNFLCNYYIIAPKKAIDENKPRFQIRIHFSGPITDNDGSGDNWIYDLNNSSLKIKYTS